ncbi:MAG: OmpA family protein [Silicimonas sp.]|nr:OmpA family protein [Silicimonas sp.]
MLALLALFCPTTLMAGPVVLTTLDGSLTLEGELTSYDGEFFRVKTAFGALTMDGGNVLCDGPGCPDPDAMVARSRIAGPAGMIHGLMPPLLEVFAEREGFEYRRRFLNDSNVVWELSDPATGRRLAIFDGEVREDDEVLTHLASRELDIVLGRQSTKGPVRQDVIALDALVPIVAPANPRAMVTQSQLSQLLSGRIDNWSVLGGPDLPVTLHLLEGSEEDLRKWHPSRQLGVAIRHDDPATLADAVAGDPAALGVVPYSMIGNAVPLVFGGACGLAIPATRNTIRSEDYPLTKPLFLQRIGARQPKIVRDFIAFARSHEAQPVIRSVGYVDQAIGRIAFERQGGRIANAVLAAGDDSDAGRAVRDMVGALMNKDRLTLTFRFQDGSSELDPQSASNVRRLSDAINRGDFDGTSLYFVGFSDGVGPADGNQRLSNRRAQSVRAAVAARVEDAPVDLRVEAYGEAMPMACDDTNWGRQVNRRVEVWMK